MLLLAITSFTNKEIYSKIVVTIKKFMLKLHIYFIYTYETEMLQKRITKYTTHNDLHWFFSKVNICSVLSNSNSIYKHYT